MPPGSFSPSLAVGVDGRLWLSNGNAAQTFDPKAAIPEPPVPVHIEAVVADHKAIALADTISFPSKPRDLEISYTAISLGNTSKLDFEYRLDGHDTAWNAVGSRRQAFYSELNPGEYRFRVRASLGDDRWTEAYSPLNLSIPPAYYETIWFRSLALVIAVALVLVAYQVRMHQLATRLKDRYRTRLAERERIARELHDTLLQGTQSLILKVESAGQMLPEAHPARVMLAHALDLADDVTAQGRDRIHDLRTSAELNIPLREAIAAFGQTLFVGQTVRFEVVETGAVRELRESVDDDVRQICREAVTNALQHAAASSIRVRIIHDPAFFELTVVDDGRGIDGSVLSAGSKPGHWGLPGMRERAERIGGVIVIISYPDCGTTVELRLDAARAYSTQRGLLQRLLKWRIAAPA
jgi:signal transduction histidine kinase